MGTTKNPKRKPPTKEQSQDTDRLKKIWDEKAPLLALTQAKAAKKFGFANPSAVSQYLNGRIPLNMKMADETWRREC